AFLGICPSSDEAAALARQAKEFAVTFPLFRDDKLAAARAFQARTVPEVFVLDRQLVLRYRGRIDDTYAARLKKKAQTTRHDVKPALDELIAAKPISLPVTEAVGCPILFEKPRVVSPSSYPLPHGGGEGRVRGVTFHRDVLPILQKRCQQCHRPGEVG